MISFVISFEAVCFTSHRIEAQSAVFFASSLCLILSEFIFVRSPGSGLRVFNE